MDLLIIPLQLCTQGSAEKPVVSQGRAERSYGQGRVCPSLHSSLAQGCSSSVQAFQKQQKEETAIWCTREFFLGAELPVITGGIAFTLELIHRSKLQLHSAPGHPQLLQRKGEKSSWHCWDECCSWGTSWNQYWMLVLYTKDEGQIRLTGKCSWQN